MKNNLAIGKALVIGIFKDLTSLKRRYSETK